ncbi:MAG: hypothetical protein MI723_14225 [Caulobacterales bacterium]|nr:hypothetical protein [Caulobacterales bacterium]
MASSAISLAAANDPITVSVVRSFDELTEAMSLRTLAFLGEQDCPFDEEFDGNDLTANHLLARFDGAPAATCRIRCFAGFAKIERVCTHPRHRTRRLLKTFVSEILGYCARKGYSRAITHIQAHRAKQWVKFGFRVREERPRFRFSDHEYVEIEIDLPPDPHALHEFSDPEILNRPEGEWDRPGVLEQSRRRGAVNVGGGLA